MAVTPKSSWPWVRTLLHSVFDQPDAESVAAQYDRIIEALADKLPKVADHLEEARADLLAEDGPGELILESSADDPAEIRLCRELLEQEMENESGELQRLEEELTEWKTQKEPEPEQPEKKSGSGLLAVVALLVLAGGGAFAYVKFIKPNRSGVKVSADPDEYDFEDEEYLTEDESGDIKDN
jgi:hypothetical protein